MRNDFIEAGKTQFGSGWAWLVLKNGKLEVMKTPNGENPLMHGATPILGCDVWEHSYYIDYRNARPKYLEAWFDNLINWEHVEAAYRLSSHFSFSHRRRPSAGAVCISGSGLDSLVLNFPAERPRALA